MRRSKNKLKDLQFIVTLFVIIFLGVISCIPQNKPSRGLVTHSLSIDAPFEINISEVSFPDREFLIIDFGAKQDSSFDNAEAINQTIIAANEAGGGKVVIPEGFWHTSAIRLKSNVNLSLKDGAILAFSDNRENYLPQVFTRWEGIECMNYSPLIYAKDCENIAITGNGELRGNGQKWWEYVGKKRLLSLTPLYDMVIDGVPPKNRIMATSDSLSYLRPSFVQFLNCKNILLEEYTITSGPMWTNHMVYCQNVIARNLKVLTKGHNTDGLVIDSSEEVLVEDCFFSTGDDCIVIKSGLNEDGWRVNRPTKNVVIRNCNTERGNGGVVIGSEMSGGIENILAQDCKFNKTSRGLRIKSMRGRGGYVSNIYFRNIEMDTIKQDAIKINMKYGSSSIKPRGTKAPIFGNINIENVTTNYAKFALRMQGLSDQPIEGISIKNFSCASSEFGIIMDSCSAISLKSISINSVKEVVKDFRGNENISIHQLKLNGDWIDEL